MSLSANYDKQQTDIDNGGAFLVDIVGESNYSRNLQHCYKDKDALPKNEGGRAKIIIVELELEDWNKHDKWAVAVVSRYGMIGYLRKEMAVIYRQKYKGKDKLKVKALISSKDPSSGLFGVWLDLPIDSDKREPVPIPSIGGRIEWKKQTKSIRDKFEFSEQYRNIGGNQGCAGAFILMAGILLTAVSVPIYRLFT
ncbi:hypothetical protein ACSF86_08740 [Moraxella bovoculi]|uniref:hypothetical protein n=1 Tax=Moraxella bovoculi TaxID=386891 RepID=UPI003F501968